MDKCANPECEYMANPDPAISIGFCCEKCEGRFNGEEWALSGKKKHTAYCTSKTMEAQSWEPEPAWGGGGKGTYGGYGKAQTHSMKCAHPECNFMTNSDPSISQDYCCEKCEGLDKGEEWAVGSGGKRHYKSCEKREFVGGMGGGYGKGAQLGSWATQAFAAAAGWGGGQFQQKGQFVQKGGPYAPSPSKGFVAKGKGKDSSKGNMHQYTAACKVWVGDIPEGTTIDAVKEHFGMTGYVVKDAFVRGTTGAVAFENEQDAEDAITVFNGSDLDGSCIKVDVWSQGAKKEE